MFNRILILQHKGGEYISINISGIKTERNTIWETITLAEEKLSKPSTTSNVALQILDSKLSKDEIKKIVNWLFKMKENISHLAIIGAAFKDKLAFNRLFKEMHFQLNRKYIYDWDTAKDWLVSVRIQ